MTVIVKICACGVVLTGLGLTGYESLTVSSGVVLCAQTLVGAVISRVRAHAAVLARIGRRYARNRYLTVVSGVASRARTRVVREIGEIAACGVVFARCRRARDELLHLYATQRPRD